MFAYIADMHQQPSRRRPMMLIDENSLLNHNHSIGM
jgi:hypothetical protein